MIYYKQFRIIGWRRIIRSYPLDIDFRNILAAYGQEMLY